MVLWHRLKPLIDSSVVFLAKSFSRFSKIRFNAVAPGLLKTSARRASRLCRFLFVCEQVIPRKQAVQTQEAADAAVYLLSPRSSGIKRPNHRVDAHVDQLLRRRN